jgi:hypothetical protein
LRSRQPSSRRPETSLGRPSSRSTTCGASNGSSVSAEGRSAAWTRHRTGASRSGPSTAPSGTPTAPSGARSGASGAARSRRVSSRR